MIDIAGAEQSGGLKDRVTGRLHARVRKRHRRGNVDLPNLVAREFHAAFAPVIVDECRVAEVAPIAQAGPGAIEIVIGAATVRVAPEIDAASLQAVLRAVMAVT